MCNRSYVFQFVTADLDDLVSSFLLEIDMPLILGLDQVAHSIDQVRAVFIVKNIEMGASELDKAVESVLDACYKEDIPIVFTHTRRSLGKLILKTKFATVSCVGIPKNCPDSCVLEEILEFGWRNRILWRQEFCQLRFNPFFNLRNENPLWIACFYGLRDPFIYSDCVKNGISIDEVDSVNGHTPLMVAALLGRLWLIQILLDLDADVEIKSFSGENVLWMCAFNGFMEGWEYIVEFASRKFKKSIVYKLIHDKNACGLVGWHQNPKAQLHFKQFCESNGILDTLHTQNVL